MSAIRITSLALMASSLLPLAGCIVVVGNTSRGYTSAEYSTASGRPKRIGIEIEFTSRALAAQCGVEASQTCVIKDVLVGSPAERAGLRKFDLVVAVDGQPDGSWDSLAKAIREREAGQNLGLRVLRGGQTIDIVVTIEEQHAP